MPYRLAARILGTAWMMWLALGLVVEVGSDPVSDGVALMWLAGVLMPLPAAGFVICIDKWTTWRDRRRG